MDTGRTEREPASSLGAGARKRAFAAAVVLLGAGAALIVLLGPPGSDGSEQGGGEGAERTVVPPPARGAVGNGGPPVRERLATARAAARRFARAYLERESGRMDAATRRVLRATSMPALWRELRRPVRVTPAWRPAPAEFERLSGISQAPTIGVVLVTIAYRVEGRHQYLGVRLGRGGRRWRVLPKGL